MIDQNRSWTIIVYAVWLCRQSESELLYINAYQTETLKLGSQPVRFSDK